MRAARRTRRVGRDGRQLVALPRAASRCYAGGMAKRKKAKKAPELTGKQRLFVAEYLIDFNATRAAKEAGYSLRTAQQIGSKNMLKHVVKEAIDKAIRARLERAKMDADEVLRELARIAGSDILSYVSFSAAGVGVRNSSELTRDEARALSEVSETVNAQGQRSVKFKTHDKMRALDLLAKHLGIIKDRTEHTGKGGGPIKHAVEGLSKKTIDEVKQDLLGIPRPEE